MEITPASSALLQVHQSMLNAMLVKLIWWIQMSGLLKILHHLVSAQSFILVLSGVSRCALYFDYFTFHKRRRRRRHCCYCCCCCNCNTFTTTHHDYMNNVYACMHVYIYIYTYMCPTFWPCTPEPGALPQPRIVGALSQRHSSGCGCARVCLIVYRMQCVVYSVWHIIYSIST